MNKAVFLDRDDTISRDVPYCRRPEDFELLPTVCQAIRLLNENNYKVVVITNQSGIGRGYFTLAELNLVHEKMEKELARGGAFVDGIYFCPHHPDDDCDCRKPKTALPRKAAREMNLAIARSFVIGDKMTDIAMAKSLGCPAILVPRGKPELNTGRQDTKPDYIAGSLYDAIVWLLNYDEQSISPLKPTKGAKE